MFSNYHNRSNKHPARHTGQAGFRSAAIVGLLILLLVSALLTSSDALADNHKRTRADAVQIAKAQSGEGRVLSVKKRVNEKGVSIFAVKIITNGRVKVIRVPEIKP